MRRILHVQEGLIEDMQEAIREWLTHPQDDLALTWVAGRKLSDLLDTLVSDLQKEERGETHV